MSGLVNRVKEVIESSGIKVIIKDKRKQVVLGKELKVHDLEERDYQQRSVQAALEHKSGIIKICTGGGKSCVIAQIIAKLDRKSVV